MAEITAKMVGDLRQRTGAGMMDCKKALKETEGDLEKAAEWLRQKGIASAEKKAGKTAAEGLVGSYIHTGGRVGILVEINCQTDFVARNEAFQALVRNVAMQVAACPQVEYVKLADIPTEIVEKEKAIEMGRDDLSGKPDNIKEKIVQGRIEKRLKELCLLDQAYIRDQNITVEELVKQNVAQLGENIQVRRFVRFVLGEGIEKEEDTFVAEIAAQMSKMQTAAAEVDVQVPVAEIPLVAEATPVEAAIVEQAQVDEVAGESAVDAAITPEVATETAETAEAAEPTSEKSEKSGKGSKGKKKK